MTSTRRRAVAVVSVAAAFAAFFAWMAAMGWFNSDRSDLRRLLGPTAAILADDSARLAAWAPDSNYKPTSYYLLQMLDEAAFRQQVDAVGLSVGPSPASAEAVWRLPEGVVLQGWAADEVPPGAGLQASGTLGGMAVWLRWHQGQAYTVAWVSSP
jgi:hypothetical protein